MARNKVVKSLHSALVLMEVFFFVSEMTFSCCTLDVKLDLLTRLIEVVCVLNGIYGSLKWVYSSSY